MNSEQFAYWLQGFLEISDVKKLDEKQLQIIRDHLKLVFNKQTPSYPGISGVITTTTQGSTTRGILKDGLAGEYDPSKVLIC